VKVTGGLEIRTADGGSVFACIACGTVLGPARESYKQHALCRERPVTDLGPLYGGSIGFIDDEFVFRELLCPGCGALLDSELNRAGEPLSDEIEVG
jgi:acetone carboxylase gamma subunit